MPRIKVGEITPQNFGDKLHELCAEALECFGPQPQMIKAAEEFAEAAAATLRYVGAGSPIGRYDVIDHMVEEVADAYIMATQMAMLADVLAPGLFATEVARKSDRLIETMREARRERENEGSRR